MKEFYNCWRVSYWEGIVGQGDFSAMKFSCNITKGFETKYTPVVKNGRLLKLREPIHVLQAGIIQSSNYSPCAKALHIPHEGENIRIGKHSIVSVYLKGFSMILYRDFVRQSYPIDLKRIINFSECISMYNGNTYFSWFLYEMIDGERLDGQFHIINNGGVVTEY